MEVCVCVCVCVCVTSLGLLLPDSQMPGNSESTEAGYPVFGE